MTDLLPILQRLGLPQYHDAFINEGFDTWETVLDIQESDLDTLGVRLGHRRKLQRAIAEYRGLPISKPLGDAGAHTPGPEPTRAEHSPQQQAFPKDSQSTGQVEQKRKYRRHPKPDENAPEKPPSGYVLFSNSIREEVKSDNLSFTDIAKLAGDRWQKLDPAQKEFYENHAAQLKDAYNTQLAEYKKTESYREYMQYLQQFKVKHEIAAEAKKPRLEHYTSSSLSTTSDGNLSESSHNTSGHFRTDSISSASTMSGQAPLHLQVTTTLPAMHGSTGARPSPTLRQPHRPGLVQTSTQSSLSDESPGSRTDADTIQRTANLSLSHPASNTPPPPSLSGRLHRTEPGFTMSHLSQPWPTWHQGHLRTVVESPEASSQNEAQTRPSRESAPEVRANAAGSDGVGFLGGAASQSAPSLSMPFSSTAEQASTASRRTLPPLLRHSPSTSSHLPFSAFGSPSVHGTNHYSQPPNESLAFRHSSWSEPNRSESEAANTLTALADRRESQPSFTSSPADSAKPK